MKALVLSHRRRLFILLWLFQRFVIYWRRPRKKSSGPDEISIRVFRHFHFIFDCDILPGFAENKHFGRPTAQKLPINCDMHVPMFELHANFLINFAFKKWASIFDDQYIRKYCRLSHLRNNGTIVYNRKQAGLNDPKINGVLSKDMSRLTNIIIH